MASPVMITDSEITGVLKRVYAQYREKVFPLITPLLANVEKGKAGGPKNMRWGGDGVYWDVVLTRPVGMTASDSGYFPPDAVATERQANMGVKRLYVTRQIDGLAITGTQSKDAAFVQLGRKVIEEAKDATKLGLQEILHGDGSAVKALVGTVNSTTSIVVSSPYGISGAGQGGLLLDVGMYVAVLDASAADAVLGKATITAVSNSGDNCTVTLSSAITGMAAGDKLVPCTTSDTAHNAYPNGLTNILNRGGSYASLHNISAGTFARWDAARLSPADADQPTESDIWSLIQTVAGRSGQDASIKPREFLLVTTPGIAKKLADTFLGQRISSHAEMATKIKGGFKAIEICGVPLVTDFWCPAGTLYLVHLPSLTWVDSKDWGQVQYEGAGPWRWIQGRDAFETSWSAYMNFGALVRNSHGMITGYTDTDRYTMVM